LNFAPVVLSVPDDVEVRKVDLAVELQILAFHEQRRGEEPPATGKAKSPTGYPPPSRGYEEALHA
jgi:redox-sensing transcriptional repressor